LALARPPLNFALLSSPFACLVALILACASPHFRVASHFRAAFPHFPVLFRHHFRTRLHHHFRIRLPLIFTTLSPTFACFFAIIFLLGCTSFPPSPPIIFARISRIFPFFFARIFAFFFARIFALLYP
jgi:hypothetical protein